MRILNSDKLHYESSDSELLRKKAELDDQTPHHKKESVQDIPDYQEPEIVTVANKESIEQMFLKSRKPRRRLEKVRQH